MSPIFLLTLLFGGNCSREISDHRDGLDTFFSCDVKFESSINKISQSCSSANTIGSTHMHGLTV